jgi:DNA-binding GntR family transcriptional regulator
MPSPAETAGPEGSPQESAADRAYAFVKRQIVSGSYLGGTLISEGEVSGSASASLTRADESR